MRIALLLVQRCALCVVVLMMNSCQLLAQDATSMDKRISNRLTLEQISEVVRSALPRGTALPQIDKYFTDNQVEHSFHKPSNKVFAIVRNIKGGGLFVTESAQIIITLDRAGDLEEIEVKSVLTSL